MITATTQTTREAKLKTVIFILTALPSIGALLSTLATDTQAIKYTRTLWRRLFNLQRMTRYEVRKDLIIFRAESWLAGVTTSVEGDARNERPLNAGWNWWEKTSNQVGVTSVQSMLYVSHSPFLIRMRVTPITARSDPTNVASQHHPWFNTAFDLFSLSDRHCYPETLRGFRGKLSGVSLTSMSI